MAKPYLRFNCFSDEWKKRKVSSFFTRVGEAVELSSTEQYQEIGIRSHGKGIFYKDFTDSDEIGNKRVFWIEPDCFVVNIVFAWERAVARTTQNEVGMIASHRFPMYKPDETVDLDYITRYFTTKRGQNVLILASPGGAGRNKTLGQKEFMESVINIPNIDEQRKIVELISSVEDAIALIEKDLQLWEQKKIGVSQKLFSQEIRFKTSDGKNYSSWNEVKLSRILTEYNEKASKGKDFEHVSLTKEGVVPKTERYERDYLVTQDDKQYRVTHINDICYNPANLKFGVICRNTYADAIFSPIYVTFKISEEYDPAFIELLVTQNDFIKKSLKYQQGTVYERMSVSPTDLCSQTVLVPCIEEQKKISECLFAIQEVINKKQKKLELWKNIKEGLLQQMFV